MMLSGPRVRTQCEYGHDFVDVLVLLQLICGVCASLWAYDLLFFFVHLFMHKVPWIYRNVHAKHHHQVALASHEVIHHSFIDGSFQVCVQR